MGNFFFYSTKKQHPPSTKDSIISLNKEYNSLNVNIIFFDEKINKSKKIHNYFLIIKKRVKGAVFGTDDIETFKKILSLIEFCQEPPPFILITSGSGAEKLLPFCNQKIYFYDILIFSTNIEKYEYLSNEYSKIKIIEGNSFDIILNFLKKKNYELVQSNVDSIHLKSEILITMNEYEDYYYQFHKLLADYYNDNNKIPSLSESDRNNFLNQINSLTDISSKRKKEVKKELDLIKNDNEFIEKIIKAYTKETSLCYSMNKFLRLLNPNDYLNIKAYSGIFMYSIYKYVKDNPSKKANEKQFRRAVALKKADLYLYKICEGDIICLPGFTSTSTELLTERLRGYLGFTFNDNNKNIYEYVDMIINNSDNSKNYETIAVNITSISTQQSEKERLFLPFSFFRIIKVIIKKGEKNDPHQIILEIINKKYNIESKIKQGQKAYYDKQSNYILTK